MQGNYAGPAKPAARFLATEAQRHRASRFDGVALRRARPESDESTNLLRSDWFADSSDPATPAGLRSRPAVEPVVGPSRALPGKSSLCLCASVAKTVFV
jgi:hypothetical protein